MIVREWLKQIHEEERRLREEQFREESRQEGRREAREEMGAQAREWYAKKVAAEQSGTPFNEPPPWEI